ncbi:unnamed protein product, partial [Ascophyllum nodosum]
RSGAAGSRGLNDEPWRRKVRCRRPRGLGRSGAAGSRVLNDEPWRRKVRCRRPR